MPKKSNLKEISEPNYPKVTISSTNLTKTKAAKYDVLIQITGYQRNRIPYAAEFTALRLKQSLKRNDPVGITLKNGTKVYQLPINQFDHFNIQCKLKAALDELAVKPGVKIAIDVRRISRKKIVMTAAAYSLMVYLATMPKFTKKPIKEELSNISIHGVVGRQFLKTAIASAQANILTRTLCIQPGNILDPTAFVNFAKACAKKYQLDFNYLNCKELAQENAGAFIAVSGKNGKGGLVKLSYRGKSKKTKSIAFLGKGVCFDTGGINVKPHKYMMGMHGDMAGAAIALATIIQAKKLKLNLNIDAYLLIAENLISADAMKPGDIITAYNGTTIEIVHTDAEGRLLLADGLSIASKTKPKVMVSLATLTGSMTIALGTKIGGIIGDTSLLAKAQTVGQYCGERLHALPMPDDYRDLLKSKVADIAQCTTTAEADHIFAALFLSNFTNKVKLLHLDLSASSNQQGLGAIPTEQTGFGASWAINWLINNKRY